MEFWRQLGLSDVGGIARRDPLVEPHRASLDMREKILFRPVTHTEIAAQILQHYRVWRAEQVACILKFPRE